MLSGLGLQCGGLNSVVGLLLQLPVKNMISIRAIAYHEARDTYMQKSMKYLWLKPDGEETENAGARNLSM